MLQNRISVDIPQSTLDAIKQTVDSLKSQLSFLQALTPEERMTMPKMGDKSRAFVEKALEVASQNPELLPRYFNEDELRKDLSLYNALYPVYLALSQLQEKLSDTLLLAGSEAYLASLVVYRSLRQLPSSAGLQATLDDLSKRFDRLSPPSPKTPSES